MDALQWFLFFVFVAFGVWVLYKMVQMYDKAKEANDEEAPYKLETPNSVAIPDVCEDNTYFRRDHFEPYCKPKRKYTKRSKYWTDKRKKAAARKAKKKTRKSK